MQPLAIGIDLGCTHIKGVLLDGSGKILDEIKADTHEQDDTQWKNSIANIVRDFKKNAPYPVKAIGLSAPGLANTGNTCISFMPSRLPGLENFVWSDWIGDNVFVINDAHAALMAEAKFGSGRGLQHVLLVTLGTGVGGGLLINGQLYQGMFQMAGHIGHTTVDGESTLRDITNMPGSIEDAIGNNTLPERSHGRYTSTEALIADFRNGDHFAAWVWLTSVRKLAVCIASATNLLSPEAVILSGGIVQAGVSLIEPLQEFLSFYEWRPGGKQTLIKIAEFTDRAGAIGAAGFAISKMK
jgi:glucokinase